MKSFKKLLAIIIAVAMIICSIPANVFAETSADGVVTDSTTANGNIIKAEIKSMPEKTVYQIGEEFDPTGLMLLVYYEDGNVAAVSGPFNFSGFDSSRAGTCYIKLFYGSYAFQLAVEIAEKEESGGDLTDPVEPEPTDPTEPTEPEPAVLPYTYVSTENGITITRYTGKEDTYLEIPAYIDGMPVTVIGTSAFSAAPLLTELIIPDTVIEIRDRAFYNCKSLCRVTVPASVEIFGEMVFMPSENLLISCPQGSKAEEYAAALGLATEIIGNGGGDIVAPVIDSAEITASPAKFTYNIGEELDTAGLEIVLRWSNGDTTLATADMLYFEGFDCGIIGEQTVFACIIGTDIKLPFTVVVQDKIGDTTPEYQGATIIRLPNKTVYKMGEQLDTSGLEVMAYNANGEGVMLSASELSVSGYDPYILGNQIIYVYVMRADMTLEFTVTVEGENAGGGEDIAPIIMSAEITSNPYKLEYQLGEQLDTTGIEVTLYWSDGKTSIATDDMLRFEGFDSSVAGARYVSVAIEGTDILLSFSVMIGSVEEGRIITGAKIHTPPSKTEYKIGEPLDLTGLFLEILWASGATTIESYEYAEARGHNAMEEGTQLITVPVNNSEFTVRFEITVKGSAEGGNGDNDTTPPIVTFARIVNSPEKYYYELGEKLDLSGMNIVLTWSDNTATLASEDMFTVSGFDSKTAGRKVVTVAINGTPLELQFPIAVGEFEGSELPYGRLNIHKSPDKTDYAMGEKLDITGLQISLISEEGIRTIITEGFTVSNYYPYLAGSQSITVSYGGMSTYFYIRVLEDEATPTPIKNPIEYVEIYREPDQLLFRPGEQFNTDGLQLFVTYKNGDEKIITDGFVAVGFNPELGGNQEIKVYYEQFEMWYYINVISEEVEPSLPDEGEDPNPGGETVIVNAAIMQYPFKTVYHIGEEFDATGLSVDALYSDDIACTLDMSQLSISGFNSEKVGECEIYVNVIGTEITLSFTVSIVDKDADVEEIRGIEIADYPQTEFALGESFNYDGLSIRISYADGNFEIITDGFTVSEISTDEEGYQTVYVYYLSGETEYCTNYDVLVGEDYTDPGEGEEPDPGEEEPYITHISILTEPIKTEYYVSETLVITGLQLEINYSNSDQEVISQGFEISGFDSSVAGVCTVTVTYGDCSTSFDVIINDLPQDSANLAIESKQVSVNADTVELKFTLSSESDITNLGIRNITFDESSFEFVSGVWTLPTEPAFAEDYVVGSPAGAVYDDATNLNGAIFTLTLRVLDEATACTTEVGCEFTAKNGDESIETMVINGTIELTEALRGDINGDGSKNNKDVIYLLNHILFPESFPLLVEGDMELDYNGDGRVSTKDVSYLLNNINWGDSDYPLN